MSNSASSSALLHIFKPGRHIATDGTALDFSESDLAASAAAYDPAKHEAPIVIGHPKHDDPAYGWVKSLSVAPDGLNAEPQQVDAAFAELVTAGRYKKISAKFYLPDSPNNPVPGVYYLRHVGFLGAQPPAVKGMRQAAFADDGEGTVEFSDALTPSVSASLWRRMREWLIGQFGQEAADKVIPSWEIESLSEQATRIREADHPSPRASAFAEGNSLSHSATTDKEPSTVTPEQKAALEAENAQLKKDLAARDAAFAEVETQAKKAAAAKRHTEHVAYAEGLKGVAAAHRDAVVAALDYAEGETSVEFGEGDKKQPLGKGLKAFLESLPDVVEYGEKATKQKAGAASGAAAGAGDDSAQYGENVDQDRLAKDREIRQHMAEHSVSYAEAATVVMRRGK